MNVAEDAGDAVEMNEITGAVISAAMKVHSALGPGLLENIYRTCLQHELTKHGYRVEAEVWLPVHYDTLSPVSSAPIIGNSAAAIAF